MRGLARLLATFAVLLVGAVATVSVCVADVDPASDILLLEDAFVSYQPVCSQIKNALVAATRRAREAGYPTKVAIIQSRTDLGAAPQFFGHPGDYAKFLGSELTARNPDSNRKLNNPHLLVLMPSGLALWPPDPRAGHGLEGVEISSNSDSNALGRVAVRAVPLMATAAGHPTAAVKIATGCSHKSNSVVLFVVPIALLVLAGVAIHFAQRGREDDA
jgi:hypothetical protein